LDEGLIVVIFPDGGERYLSTPLWSFETIRKELPKEVDLFLTNTFSGKREAFYPLIDKEVKIYTCGPTLNTRPHIGLYRRLITVDILKSFLKLMGYKVIHVVNLTDFDDKTINTALEKDVDLKDLTSKVEQEFYEDLDWLKIEKADFYPKVSEHLEDMKKLAISILEKDKAYVKYSSLYFDISRFSEYGKLSKIDLSFLKPGATIDLEEYDKEEPFDFALLKRVQILELKRGYFVETPFGKVRPTWHIHCASLVLKYLGEEIDIFTSGSDLIFPHHENTRAIAKALTGKELAKYWVHSGLVFYNGKKISSENRITIEDIKNKGFSGRVLRFYFLRTHYRNQFNFIWKGLEESSKILEKIDRYIAYLGATPENEKIEDKEKLWQILKDFENNWKEALKEDLNTPVVISEIISFFKKIYPYLKKGLPLDYKKEVLKSLKNLNKILKIFKFPQVVENKDILEKIEIREKAKKEKNYELADRIREELEKEGFFIFDFAFGTRVVSLKEEL
jgi:cysteinyl-tRNA synthetase